MVDGVVEVISNLDRQFLDFTFTIYSRRKPGHEL